MRAIPDWRQKRLGRIAKGFTPPRRRSGNAMPAAAVVDRERPRPRVLARAKAKADRQHAHGFRIARRKAPRR